MYKNYKKENGQIIVLLALSLVVVVVVAALAVDGGMIYSERRFAQNAADASSLAGGGVILQNLTPVTGTEAAFCTSVSSLVADAVSAAQTIAASNNVASLPYIGTFNDESELGADFKHGVAVVCNGTDRYIDVYVRITSSISTAFAHLIYPDALVTTNEAVTRAIPKQNLGMGNAIISLSELCINNEDGMEFNGSSVTITIEGGGVHSNSCMNANGNQLVVNVPEGGVTLVYSEPDFNPDNNVNKPDFTTDPIGGSGVVVINYPDPPVCVPGEHLDGNTYSPGTYDGIQMTANNDTWIFEPGIYCMTGDLKITGGTVSGDGVTFYMIDGDVDISGGPTVLLAAPYDPDDEFFGLLFFMDINNTGQIKLTGNNNSYFAGTVYAPSGEIIVGGTSDITTFDSPLCALIEDLPDTCQATTFSTQLIGNYVKVSGSTEMDILFDESMTFAPDGWIYLRR